MSFTVVRFFCIEREMCGCRRCMMSMIVWLTGVGGEQGATLAVDDLLDNWKILGEGSGHHAEAGHHGIQGAYSSHHAEAGIKIWRQERHMNEFTRGKRRTPTQWSTDWFPQMTPWSGITSTLAFLSIVHEFPRVIILPTPVKHERLLITHRHSWINHHKNNTIYFKKFSLSHSRYHSYCLHDDLIDNAESYPTPTKRRGFIYSIYMHRQMGKQMQTYTHTHIRALASIATTCAFMCTCVRVPVWSFLKWKWSCPPVCASTSPAEDL